jgi:hypothetical protein
VLDADGKPVRRFEVEQDRRMHLIVVSRDLTVYRHVHPRFDGAGAWTVRLQLPRAGVYRAFADFKSGSRRVLGTDVFVPGDMRVRPLPAADTSVAAGDYEVFLNDFRPRKGGSTATEFTVLRSGRPVTDLQPYLGALGHLVVLREGDLSYLHVHPRAGERGAGGVVPFDVRFPSRGGYRMFLQFRHRDVVRTVPFTVRVGGHAPAPAATREHQGH